MLLIFHFMVLICRTCERFTALIHFPVAKKRDAQVSVNWMFNCGLTYNVLSLTLARNLLHVIHVAPWILFWFLDFGKSVHSWSGILECCTEKELTDNFVHVWGRVIIRCLWKCVLSMLKIKAPQLLHYLTVLTVIHQTLSCHLEYHSSTDERYELYCSTEYVTLNSGMSKYGWYWKNVCLQNMLENYDCDFPYSV